MIRLLLNKLLPVLSDREVYGLELESLKKQKKRVEKKITSLHNKSVYLECRIKGLEDTIDTIKGEEGDSLFHVPNPTDYLENTNAAVS